MEYIVTCTMIHNGAVNVNANSEDEAIEKAREILNKDINAANWQFGEATTDYAEKV